MYLKVTKDNQSGIQGPHVRKENHLRERQYGQIKRHARLSRCPSGRHLWHLLSSQCSGQQLKKQIAKAYRPILISENCIQHEER